MDRIQATRYAVAAGLIALLLSIVAYGIGADPSSCTSG